MDHSCRTVGNLNFRDFEGVLRLNGYMKDVDSRGCTLQLLFKEVFQLNPTGAKNNNRFLMLIFCVQGALEQLVLVLMVDKTFKQ